MIVREMENDASENPRCVRESDVSYQGDEARIDRPVLVKVVERSVRTEKASQHSVTQKVSEAREE